MNEKWEYLTRFLQASVDHPGVKDFLGQARPNWKKPPPYAPEAMIPELNDLGNEGWEMIHMEPVARVGKKGDVLIAGGSDAWSNTYFCVFKRRRP